MKDIELAADDRVVEKQQRVLASTFVPQTTEETDAYAGMLSGIMATLNCPQFRHHNTEAIDYNGYLELINVRSGVKDKIRKLDLLLGCLSCAADTMHAETMHLASMGDEEGAHYAGRGAGAIVRLEKLITDGEPLTPKDFTHLKELLSLEKHIRNDEIKGASESLKAAQYPEMALMGKAEDILGELAALQGVTLYPGVKRT